MSSVEVVIFAVQIAVTLMVSLILFVATKAVRRQILAQEKQDHRALRRQQIFEKNRANQHIKRSGRNSRLSSRFWGNAPKSSPNYATLDLPDDAPTDLIVLIIMAKQQKHISGADIRSLVDKFALYRSPHHTYERTDAHNTVLFTLLLAHQPFVFPEELETTIAKGLMLTMQLPLTESATSSMEMLFAVAHDMCEELDARLCDSEYRPIGDKKMLAYHQRAEAFEARWQEWLLTRNESV